MDRHNIESACTRIVPRISDTVLSIKRYNLTYRTRRFQQRMWVPSATESQRTAYSNGCPVIP